MTTPPSIYKEIPITYGEMIEVLIKLGYHKEPDGKNNRFINDAYKSMVILPNKEDNSIVELIHVESYSYRLFLQGVLKAEEDLIKMVQKNRVKKNKAANLPKRA
jgi:hypothetical protein